MNQIEKFEMAQNTIRGLDVQGWQVNSDPMYRAFQRRNSFGLDQDKKIYRIFQKDFLEKDISDRYLTLPRACASVWNDSLENPLASVYDVEIATGLNVHIGSLVSSFYALCWTHRAEPSRSDWDNFSHGKEPVRISSTIEKLMDRMMRVSDRCYMHRSWLVEVDYKDPEIIRMMQNPQEVYRRVESQGALLALSAAVVRTEYADEDEIRLLFDPSILPPDPDIVIFNNPGLVRVPFDWKGFIDNQIPGH